MLNIRRTLEPLVLTITGLLFPVYSLYWIITHFTVADIGLLYLVTWAVGVHITVFMHRAWTHRAWQPKQYLNIYALFMYTIGFVGTSVGWCATHRHHHRYSDTAQDPHSPYFKGRFRIQFLAHYLPADLTYAKDLFQDRYHMWFAKNYWTINLFLFLCLLLISPNALLFWFAVLGLNSFKMFLVNNIGHWNNRTKSHTNSPVLAYIYLQGEPWHANHHADPKNWRFGKHWYEIDLGAQLIKLFVKLGWGTAR